MKKICLVAVIVCCTAVRLPAQKQNDQLPYNKEKLDSMFRSFPKLIPANANTFEANNPGATIINKTPRGTMYNMPLDNMAVLVPDMQSVERMPVAGLRSGDNMPNPLKKEKKN